MHFVVFYLDHQLLSIGDAFSHERIFFTKLAIMVWNIRGWVLLAKICQCLENSPRSRSLPYTSSGDKDLEISSSNEHTLMLDVVKDVVFLSTKG